MSGEVLCERADVFVILCGAFSVDVSRVFSKENGGFCFRRRRERNCRNRTMFKAVLKKSRDGGRGSRKDSGKLLLKWWNADDAF